MRRYFWALLVVAGVGFFYLSFVLPTIAYAQVTTVTVTPTITAPPPYQPDINYTPMDFECPEGTPIGWGTVTPSASWLLLCDECIPSSLQTSTAILEPTMDATQYPTEYAGTATAEYLTGTPTPSVTETIIPTGTPSGCDVSLNGEPSFSFTPRNWVVVSSIVSNTFACVDNGMFVSCTGSITIDDPGANEDDVLNIEIPISYPLGSAVFVDVIGTDPYGGDWSGAWLEYATIYGGSSSHFFYPSGFQYSMAGSNGYIKLSHIATAGSVWTGTFTYNVKIYSSPDCLIPPTVTPTPIPEEYSYCDVVRSEEDDSGFDWTGIEIIGSSCWDLGGPGLTSDGGGGFWDWFGNDLWKSLGSPNIPWIAHVCLVGIDLGILTVFNVSISLLVVAYTVGLALILRNMFVS